MMAVIMVCVRIVRGPHVFHLVDAPAFGAALDGAVAGCLCCFQLRFFTEWKIWRGGEEGVVFMFVGKGGREGGKRTNGEPFDGVGIGGAAGAAAVLFVAEGFDHDGVVEGT